MQSFDLVFLFTFSGLLPIQAQVSVSYGDCAIERV